MRSYLEQSWATVELQENELSSGSATDRIVRTVPAIGRKERFD